VKDAFCKIRIDGATLRVPDCGSVVRRRQEQHRAWLGSLTDNLAESATSQARRAICGIDLSELEAMGAAERLAARRLRDGNKGSARRLRGALPSFLGNAPHVLVAGLEPLRTPR
jgi:hypothetical protein